MNICSLNPDFSNVSYSDQCSELQPEKCQHATKFTYINNKVEMDSAETNSGLIVIPLVAANGVLLTNHPTEDV